MDKDTIIRIQLAKTGKFGADGAIITVPMLEEVVDTFDGKCPVSLGHYMARRDWWPSFGNVENVSLEKSEDGNSATLYGDVTVNAVLKEAIDNGLYPSWSVSIPARAADGKHYLHHLAFLGAVPPKIRDLEIIKTSDNAIPENAIAAEGEGTNFADFAYYSASDFADSVLDPQPKQTPKDNPQDEPEDNFSDNPEVQKARKIIRNSKIEKLTKAAEGLLPAGKESLLTDFADAVITDSFDFADEEGRDCLDILADLFAAIKSKPQVQTGRFNFADNAKDDAVQVDRQKMAQKF